MILIPLDRARLTASSLYAKLNNSSTTDLSTDVTVLSIFWSNAQESENVQILSENQKIIKVSVIMLVIIIYYVHWGGCMIWIKRCSLFEDHCKRYFQLLLIISFASPDFNNRFLVRLLYTDISSLGEERQGICHSGWSHYTPVNYLLRSTFDKSQPAKYIVDQHIRRCLWRF